MKTDKKNIENELEELGATFLLKEKKKQLAPEFDAKATSDSLMKQIKVEKKPSTVRRITFFLGGIAASLILTLLLVNTFDQQNIPSENTLSALQKEDILYYLEDEIINFSEDEILLLIDEEETNNLFDNSGISDSYLEEYFINELNEEILLEELL